MLQSSETSLKEIVLFINTKKLTHIPCRVVFYPNHTRVRAKSNVGYALYVPEKKAMHVAGQPPMPSQNKQEFLFESIAHEYAHHLQNIKNKPFNEPEAYLFAELLLKEYQLQISSIPLSEHTNVSVI